MGAYRKLDWAAADAETREKLPPLRPTGTGSRPASDWGGARRRNSPGGWRIR